MIALLILCSASLTAWATPMRLSSEDGLTAEVFNEGSIKDRLAPSDAAHVVVFYTGEQRGDLQPCGCSKIPRGGLPRTAAYIHEAGMGLVLNGAGWIDEGQTLDGSPMADAKLKNEWMIRGLKQLGADVIHVGFGDLMGLSRMDKVPDLPLVSTNLRGPGLKTHQILRFGELKVGVLAISQPGHISIATPGFERLDPYRSSRAILDEVANQSDVVILLNNDATPATKKLVRTGQIDVVIETAHHRGFEAPFRHGKAIWVRSHDQGLRLGELRLYAQEKSLMTATDRKIDLNEELDDDPTMASIAKEAERELKALERALFSP